MQKSFYKKNSIVHIILFPLQNARVIAKVHSRYFVTRSLAGVHVTRTLLADTAIVASQDTSDFHDVSSVYVIPTARQEAKDVETASAHQGENRYKTLIMSVAIMLE